MACYNPAIEYCCESGNGKACLYEETCCGSDCCDPTQCETCVDGECIVCEGDPELTCYNGHCCCAPNGCGSCGGTSYPDNPTACEDTSFLAACDAHDACYGDCGHDKADCDTTFHNAMIAVCNGSSCEGSCLIDAAVYYLAVHLGGGDAFNAAQSCSCGD